MRLRLNPEWWVRRFRGAPTIMPRKQKPNASDCLAKMDPLEAFDFFTWDTPAAADADSTDSS